VATRTPGYVQRMRVVVVGATGNLGTAVVRALEADPAVTSVLGLARRPPAHDAGAATTYAAADVATDDLVPHLRGADAVVHLAWRFQPTHRPDVTWAANAVGSARVLDAAAAAGVGVVVSTSSVGAYSPRDDDEPVDETWPTHSLPHVGYGREKAYVERVVDAFEARHPDIRVVRLRPAFVFQRAAATAQRRLFLGPLTPGSLLRPGLLPVLPHPPGLRVQALHADDLAAAVRLAVVGEARGAFNLAADPVLDAARLAAVLGARAVAVPRLAVRGALAAAWHTRLVPAEPALLDLVLAIPLMSTARAREELGWVPQSSSEDALREALHGMADGAGGDTPQLAPDSPAGRAEELRTGVGQRP
jgi:nucleoside-diphosphate-sugar epimerase